VSSPELPSPELPSNDPVVPLKITLGQEYPPPPPIVIELPKTEIDLLDVIFILLALAVISIFWGVIAAVIYMAAHHGKPVDAKTMGTNVFFILPVEFVVYAAVLGFMAFLAWVRHRRSLLDAVGWNNPDGKLATVAVFTGLGLAFVSSLTSILLNRWIPKSLPMSELFKDRPSAFLLAGFAVLVAPLMEEMFFRGVLYPALARSISSVISMLFRGDVYLVLARSTGSVISILITSVAFTALHASQLGYSWAALLPIFIVGTTLTIMRAVKKSLAACVLIHMTYNFLLMVVAFIGSHGFRDMHGI
jgi:hypothetical protein